MKTDNVIFDFSGTLADDRDKVHQTMNLVLDHYEQERIDFDTWRKVMSLDFKTVWENLGVRAPLEEIIALYRQCYGDSCEIKQIPGNTSAINLLHNELGKGALSVVSACPKDELESHLGDLGLLPYFGKILGDQTNKAETLKGFPLEKSLYVGDMESDGIAANRTGIPFVAIDNKFAYHERARLEKYHPKYVINHLNELIRIVKNGR